MKPACSKWGALTTSYGQLANWLVKPHFPIYKAGIARQRKWLGFQNETPVVHAPPQPKSWSFWVLSPTCYPQLGSFHSPGGRFLCTLWRLVCPSNRVAAMISTRTGFQGQVFLSRGVESCIHPRRLHQAEQVEARQPRAGSQKGWWEQPLPLPQAGQPGLRADPEPRGHVCSCGVQAVAGSPPTILALLCRICPRVSSWLLSLSPRL